MRARSAPPSYGAPRAGSDAAGPRPDLRGFRGAQVALLERLERELKARRLHGLVGGFVAGLILGLALLAAGGPGVAAVLAAATANFAVAVWLPPMLLAPADRRFLGIVNRLAVAAAMSWRRAYGKARIPRTEEEQLLWIAAQPDDTADVEAIAIEGSILLLLGRYDAARERVQRIPDDTPWRLFDRELAFAAIDFDSGGLGDLGAAREAAANVMGPRQPLVLAGLALEEAGRAVIRGDDWDPVVTSAAAAAGTPPLTNIWAALSRAIPVLPWLLGSELVLGVALYLVATPAGT